MEDIRKPPIGLKPRFLAEEQYRLRRINAIKNAIDRYIKLGFVISISWIEEYNDLIKKRK